MATGARLRAAREAEYPAKCFSVAWIPADCRPRTYAVPTEPTRYGSSPMVSSVRPQRGSLVTSRTGERPWWMPTARMLAPMAAAIWQTSSGSKDAPQASGVGKMVAVQAAKPVRHSSCATAGMPNLLAATTCACTSRSVRAASAGGTGRVPNTRVSWPRPARMSSANGASEARKSPCIGATLPSRAWRPSQMLVSCAAFSSSVIRPSRSATRSAAVREGSRQSCVSWSITGRLIAPVPWFRWIPA